MNNRQKYIENVMNCRTRHAIKNECNRLYKEVHGVAPQIYAAFALVLNKYVWTQDQIEELFLRTSDLWEMNERAGVNMCKLCEERTGIDVEGRK